MELCVPAIVWSYAERQSERESTANWAVALEER